MASEAASAGTAGALAAAATAAAAGPSRAGIVGGLGLGAGIHYYRELAAARPGAPLELVLVHCQISTALGLVDTGDKAGLAIYLAEVIGQLKAAGATFAVVPAVTPHYCIDELNAIAPLPVVDMLEAIRDEVGARRLQRVALFGTRAVQESACYGRLSGLAEVVLPPPAEVARIDELYTEIAKSMRASPEQRDAQRAELTAQADRMIERDGVEAILLAGTDLSAVFDASNTPFPHLDCAALHIQAVLKRLQ